VIILGRARIHAIRLDWVAAILLRAASAFGDDALRVGACGGRLLVPPMKKHRMTVDSQFGRGS
jgi:hypothetical protein